MVRILVQSIKIVTIGLIAALVVFGSARAFDYYRDQAAVEGRYGRKVVVRISSRDDVGEVADKLKKANLINSALYFDAIMRVSGKEINPATYQLEIGMSTRTIVDLITTEKSEAKTSNPTLKITVIEGWRTEQIAEELDSLGLNGGYDAFMQAVKNFDGSGYDFLDGRPNKQSLEGYLFPDTYEFKADTPPEQIIELMLANFDSKFDSAMRDRAQEMGLSINEVLIFASLVQREAQLGQEFPIVAGVYINRFEQGIRMDADPTVQYVLGKKGDWWPVINGDDLFVDSPYNTYQNEGLPPAPIANVGLVAITGVLQPAQTDYIFFVARGDGSHLFAVDNASQDQNVAFLDGEAAAPAACSVPYVDDCGYITPP